MRFIIMAVFILSGCGADDDKTERVICPDPSLNLIEEQLAPSTQTICEKITDK